MSVQRACDVCGFYRQDKDGNSTVRRYGLSRQSYRRENGRKVRFRESSYGGIDLCDICWDRIGKPKTRPETRGKTGPKPALQVVKESA